MWPSFGAGPYGLSIAAHLRAQGVAFSVFGSPISTWLNQMPKGMRLTSEGFASSLSDPDSTFTLGQYCQELGIPSADLGLPVLLATFASYGIGFQRRFVPTLEDKQVTSLRRSNFRVGINRRRLFIAQCRVHGRSANCAVVCWRGRVLAGIGVELVSSNGVKGPAIVVRVIESPEMMYAAERTAAHLGLSGFFGLDFMVDDDSGAIYLIEMNPRCTPLCPLQLGARVI